MSNRFRQTDAYRSSSFFTVDEPGGTVNYGSIRVGDYSSIQDVSTPGFAQRIKQGQVIMNNMERVKRSVSDSAGFGTVGPYPGWGVRYLYGNLAGVLGIPGPGDVLDQFSGDISNAKNNCLTNAYAKVDAATIAGLTYTKEFSQTVEMLRKPLKSSISLINKILRAKKRHLGKTTTSATKASANAWLEYRYGWNPLLQDISAVADDIEKRKLNVVDGSFQVARAGMEFPESYKEKTGQSNGGFGSTQVTYAKSLKVKRRVGAGVIYKVVDEAPLSAIKRRFGYRVQDVIPAVWEVVPWSFVVDWFLGIGPWLSAIVPKPNVRYHGNWVTTVQTWEGRTFNVLHRKDVQVNPNPLISYKNAFPDASAIETRIERLTNQSITLTPLVVEKNLSLLRQVDALALLSTSIVSKLGELRH